MKRERTLRVGIGGLEKFQGKPVPCAGTTKGSATRPPIRQPAGGGDRA